MACLLASEERCESRQPSLRRPREGTKTRRPRAAAKGNRRPGTGEGALQCPNLEVTGSQVAS